MVSPTVFCSIPESARAFSLQSKRPSSAARVSLLSGSSRVSILAGTLTKSALSSGALSSRCGAAAAMEPEVGTRPRKRVSDIRLDKHVVGRLKTDLILDRVNSRHTLSKVDTHRKEHHMVALQHHHQHQHLDPTSLRSIVGSSRMLYKKRICQKCFLLEVPTWSRLRAK